MFSNYDRLRRRTGQNDLNRNDFLQALVNEYQDTVDPDAREQVLANLANFAYDPINFERLRALGVPALFVDCLEVDENLNSNTSSFGLAGLCNLLAAPVNRELLLAHSRALSLITRCLGSDRLDSKLSAITCLSQMVTAESRGRVMNEHVRAKLQEFKSVPDNPRLSNLASAVICMHGG